MTCIGHGAPLVATVQFLVAAGHPVRVYSADPGAEEALSVYGADVRRIEPGYATRPEDLPPPPYVCTLDRAELLARVRSWLPATAACFQAVGRRRPARGWIQLLPQFDEAARRLGARLAALERVDRIQAMARTAQRPLILMYGDPDPDAIGAAMGLDAILRAAGAEPALRYTGDIQRYQNRLLLKYLRRRITRLDADELAASDLVCVVDAQPGFWREGTPNAHVVIDHHPVREDTRADYLDLRPDYGATSTILCEYLDAAGLPIPRPLATALLYGITTDTDDLRRHAGPSDIAAYELLHPRCDRAFMDRLQKSQIPVSLLDPIAWGISHRVVYRDLALIHFGEIATPDICVQVADLLLLTCGITVVVCAGIVGRGEQRRLVVVFRGDGYHMDVGRRARDAFAEVGSAGGHRTMGRAEIPLADAVSAEESAALLVDRLFRRMSPTRRQRLLRMLREHLAAPRPADPDDFELET